MTTSAAASRAAVVSALPGTSPRPVMPSSVTISMIVRSAYGACRPAALSSGGSPTAMGVTCISVMRMVKSYVRSEGGLDAPSGSGERGSTACTAATSSGP